MAKSAHCGVCIALAALGFICIVSPWQGVGEPRSVALAVGAGLSWAIATVVSKRLFERQPTITPLQLTVWQMLVGTVILIIPALAVPERPVDWTCAYVWALLYKGLLSSGLYAPDLHFPKASRKSIIIVAHSRYSKRQPEGDPMGLDARRSPAIARPARPSRRPDRMRPTEATGADRRRPRVRSLLCGFFLFCAVLVAPSALAAGRQKERIVIPGAPPRIGLFLSDANGSNERPLLPGASDYNPSFSADGKWIVFTSERSGKAEIYRVHLDGSGLERLTDNRSFDDQGSLSPDGWMLAFVSTRDGGRANIWLLDLRTRQARNLTKSSSGNFRPAWSPDGKWIAFTSDRNAPHRRAGPGKPPPTGSGCCGWELVQSTALYIVHPRRRGLRRLTPRDQFAGSPKWSADAKRIVYYQQSGNERGSQIASINIGSGAKLILTSGDDVKLSPQYLNQTDVAYLIGSYGKTALADTSGRKGPPGNIWNPAWSPDGKLAVYAKPLKEAVSTPGALIPIARRDAEFEFFQDDLAPSSASYSPDGRRVVIASNPGPGKHALILMDADGTHARQLFAPASPGTFIGSVAWSPDGNHVAFMIGRSSTRNPVSAAQLALIRIDRSDLRMLTQGENSSGFASFSPDGKRIVYRVLGHERGLRIISLEDGKIATLTTDWDDFPAWSPRGDRIVFSSFRSGDFEIYTIRPDGTDLRQLTHDHGNDAHAIWSPDGRSILFASSRTGWKDEAMLAYAAGGRSPQSYGKLFVMRADGTNVRQVTDNQWEEAPIAWLPAAEH